MPDLSGYARAVLSRHDGSVEVAMSPPGNPSHYDFCYITDLTYEKNLVMISVFRDALVHSLPVAVRCSDKDKIVEEVSIRARHSLYGESKPSELKTASGKVSQIEITDSGVRQDSWTVGGEAGFSISGAVVYLDLRRPDREIKMAQLSLLRFAYEKDLDVVVQYQQLENKAWIISVRTGDLAGVISGPLKLPGG
jgi:hypothetical protein